MPPLDGSEKQVAYAAKVRYRLMWALYEWAVEQGNANEDAYDAAEEQARGIDQARWWLDNMHHCAGDTNPEALLELLAAAAERREGTDCENDY